MNLVDKSANQLGWRGLWLVVVGVVWLCLGVGTLLEEGNPIPWVPLQQAPPLLVAAGWWITGGVAIWTGMRGKVADDSWGHVALYVMPAAKVLSFSVAWLIALASPVMMSVGLTDEPIGYMRGWYAALIWGVVSVMLAVTAGWPNPPPCVPTPPADE